MNIPKSLIGMTNVILVMNRTEIEGRPARRISTATELNGLDQSKINMLTEQVFSWNPKSDQIHFSGRSSLLQKQMSKLGIDEEDVKRELNRRQAVLEWMTREGIRRYTEVANVIREYYANPDRIFQKARVGLR
jgi:flagellar protein FlaI